jgi:tungstate transport system substrate-binding protein
MYNDFIIVGPKKNPAKINRTDSPVKAFTKIYNTQSFFSSRGDESGTNSKEKAIWNISNLNPQKFSGKWYRETGSGMGATLNLAAGMAAYTLTDRATWINFQNKLDLFIVTENNEILFNQYGITLVNPKRCPNVKVNNSIKFINWLLSEKGQNTIRNFKIKDEYLFYPNAN